MSKTKQRKDQAYYEGYHDALKERVPLNKRPTYLRHYHRGHRDGLRALKERREYLPTLGYDDL